MKSKVSHAQLDIGGRIKKAKKIISVLNEYKDLRISEVLDMGIGAGVITSEIAKLSRNVYGVDILDERVINTGYRFIKIKDEKLPFKSNSFDVVISNHVIEHIKNQSTHLREIHRVLKKGGICYLATPNKLSQDPHYKIPLISIFPRKVSNALLRKLKHKDYDIYPLTYNKLKGLCVKFFFKNMTLKVIRNPKKYNLDYRLSKFSFLLNALPDSFINLLVPTYIVILRK